MNLENLDSVVDFITLNNLIECGDSVGIGVSGGNDSMALLHLLNSLRESLEINIVAVHVNHGLRKAARKDAAFVAKYCSDNDIKYVGYTVDVAGFAQAKKMSTENAARIKRYECFSNAIKRFKLNKFALAHHQSDQAETILLHIFRGSGIAGARGMDAIREFTESGAPCKLVRPFLETPHSDIIAYNYRNQIKYVQDESNFDDKITRNYLRNQIIPALQHEWRNVEKNIVDFGRNCRSDDEYLNGVVNLNALVHTENCIRIPLNFFAYPYPIISRILLAAFKNLVTKENIEKKHIDLIVSLAESGENGSRTDLPNGLYAVKEYEYMSIVRRVESAPSKVYAFKVGKTAFAEYGTIIVTKTIAHKDAIARGLLVVDTAKLPRNARWRTRKDGDTFTKFGGGTKLLNAYLIDKKVPTRLRDKLPVLAVGAEVLIVGGIEISDKIKTDRETMQAYVVEFVKD